MTKLIEVGPRIPVTVYICPYAPMHVVDTNLGKAGKYTVKRRNKNNGPPLTPFLFNTKIFEPNT